MKIYKESKIVQELKLRKLLIKVRRYKLCFIEHKNIFYM